VNPILDAAAARQPATVAEHTTQRIRGGLAATPGGTSHAAPTQPSDTAVAPRRTDTRDLGRALARTPSRTPSRGLERDGGQA
jgi:hypothetical protein